MNEVEELTHTARENGKLIAVLDLMKALNSCEFEEVNYHTVNSWLGEYARRIGESSAKDYYAKSDS